MRFVTKHDSSERARLLANRPSALSNKSQQREKGGFVHFREHTRCATAVDAKRNNITCLQLQCMFEGRRHGGGGGVCVCAEREGEGEEERGVGKG